MHVIEDDLAASSDDMSQLLDMVFSPDDTILIGGDEPPTFNTDGEEMLGEALPPRSYQRNLEELDALLGNMGGLGLPSASASPAPRTRRLPTRPWKTARSKLVSPVLAKHH